MNRTELTQSVEAGNATFSASFIEEKSQHILTYDMIGDLCRAFWPDLVEVTMRTVEVCDEEV